jgi:hypothetical protein
MPIPTPDPLYPQYGNLTLMDLQQQLIAELDSMTITTSSISCGLYTTQYSAIAGGKIWSFALAMIASP